jgi:hypothetical protein
MNANKLAGEIANSVEVVKKLGEDKLVTDDQLVQLKRLSEYITAMGEIISEKFVPIFEQVGAVLQATYDVFWQAYRDAGMPYGETDDGLLRWVKEVGEANCLRFEADRILAHHRMVANFRKVINERQRTRR